MINATLLTKPFFVWNAVFGCRKADALDVVAT